MNKKRIPWNKNKKINIDDSKYSYENVLQKFLDNDIQLLTTKEEYFKTFKSNKTRVQFFCHCGNKSSVVVECSKFLCKDCSKKLYFKKLKETNLKKYGTEYVYQSKHFIENRKKTYLKNLGVDNPMKSSESWSKRKQTCLNKYGTEHAFQSKEIQNKMRETYNKNFGVDWISKSPLWYPKVQKTLLKKYGVSNCGALSKQYSKISQELFWSIYNRLPNNLKEKTYFAELNKEFNVYYLGKYYKFDFVNSLTKKCIEFNGYNFHPKPQQKDDEINWFVFNPNKTVKEARDYEKLKYESLEQRNYQILTIWDYEFNNDKERTIKKCIDFIIL